MNSAGGSDSGADSAKVETDAEPGTSSTLTVKAIYTGAGTGTLNVVVQTADTMDLIGLKQVESPTFPQEVKFTNVPPGTYIVGGYIDVGGNNPAGPGDEDPAGGDQAEVKAGEDLTVDVTFNDPEQPDMDGGADADAS